MTSSPTTLDGLLDRRVSLEQPAVGYRVAIDTVLLAAAVCAGAGDRVLDLGCGVGGAMLCVACRVPGVKGVGLEVQPELVELCKNNILRNDFAVELEARQADATALPPDLEGHFDHVMMNPPYHEEASHDASRNKIKRTANTERTGDLALWIASGARALKFSGTLTLIHRADRVIEILTLLEDSFGDIELLPLLPKAGGDPKRMIFRAQKGAGFSVRKSTPLVLHKDEGAYTDEAEAVLRHGKSLPFDY